MNGSLAKSFCVLLLAFAAGAAADQQDERLAGLFDQLKDAGDPGAARSVETDIWKIWIESGKSDIDELMSQGVVAMSSRNFDVALEAFDKIVEQAPGFAEGWNKRATVYYLRDEMAESMLDIERTLDLEPRHFGALSGMGLIFMEQGDYKGAIKAYQEVLKIHPQSPSARFHIGRMHKLLYGESL
ncbi:MAG: tetratricopeptide repeat protein [Gammaproteobacteria bacterium]